MPTLSTTKPEPSSPDERDLILLRPVASAIERSAGGPEALAEAFPRLVRDAIDYVIDPVRTARTSVAELDNVEKTFLGLKVEHFLRDFLNVPRGVRDLDIGGFDVDVKNTTASSWMIPRETYSEDGVCLLSRIDDSASRCSLGLIVARDEYLGKENRDKKRSVHKLGRTKIHWLLNRVPFTASHWSGLDMVRFCELRAHPGGSERAAIFFQENLGVRVNRRVVESLLHDQRDFMKRLRGNQGAKDILVPLGIELEIDSEGNCIARKVG